MRNGPGRASARRFGASTGPASGSWPPTPRCCALCPDVVVDLRENARTARLAAVSCEPLRDSAHRVLIGAYLKEGNRDEAIRQYEACRQILRRELGIDPSPVTQALLPAVVTQQHAGR